MVVACSSFPFLGKDVVQIILRCLGSLCLRGIGSNLFCHDFASSVIDICGKMWSSTIRPENYEAIVENPCFVHRYVSCA